MSQTKPAADAPCSLNPQTPGADERLSAWMDGDASALEAQDHDLVTAWQRDPDTRSRWSEYHGIGDVLRSDDLAGPGDDARFLATFRARVAAEPVVLAPRPELRAISPGHGSGSRLNRAARRWAVPVSMAAGVAVVSSVVWMLQPTAQDDTRTQFAQKTLTPVPAQAVVLALDERLPARNGPRQSGPVDPLQTVEFEPYFSAHKQFQPATATGTASGFLRSAVYESR